DHDDTRSILHFAEDVVVGAFDLEELVRLAVPALVDLGAGTLDEVLAVGRELPDVGPAVVGEIRADEIALAVVIPERAAIVPSSAFHHRVQRLPWPLRARGAG